MRLGGRSGNPLARFQRHTCLSNPLHRSRECGFTLLEMLVVMALLALATGLILPRASGWLDAVQQRGWEADLKARIETLPVKAFLGGKALSIDAPTLMAGLPGSSGGAELRLPQPLAYSAAGLAEGGRVELLRGGAMRVWQVQPVTGEVREREAQQPSDGASPR